MIFDKSVLLNEPTGRTYLEMGWEYGRMFSCGTMTLVKPRKTETMRRNDYLELPGPFRIVAIGTEDWNVWDSESDGFKGCRTKYDVTLDNGTWQVTIRFYHHDWE